MPSMEDIDRGFRAEFNLMLSMGFFIILLYSIFSKSLFNNLTYKSVNLLTLFLVLLLPLISYFANHKILNLSFIQFAFFLAYIFSEVRPKFNIKITDSLIFFYVLINLIASYFYLSSDMLIPLPVEAFDSFRGIAFDRVELSYYLSIFFSWSLFFKRYFLCILIFYLVILTESRSGILCLFLITFLRASYNYKLLIIVFLINIIPIALIFSQRSPETILDLSQRFDLIKVSFLYLSETMKLIFFGDGNLYTSINSWVPHNNFLQVLLNFGLFGMVSFLLFILFLLTKLTKSNFSIFIIFIIFGLSHQDLDIFTFTLKNITWISFFLVMQNMTITDGRIAK